MSENTKINYTDIVKNDTSLINVILSFHINKEKEENKKKYDRVVKSFDKLILNFTFPHIKLPPLHLHICPMIFHINIQIYI